jgi:hypothetical protein
MKYLIDSLASLYSHKLYIIFSLAYGISTLILPFGIQFLVNKLAISGLWSNIIVFIVLIIVALIISHAIKHSQMLILETLKREIFCFELEKWKRFDVSGNSIYYFEIFNLMKSFSICYANLIEMVLVTLFGLFSIITFHPYFILLVIIIVSILFYIYKSSNLEINSALKESNQKYEIFDQIILGNKLDESHFKGFLEARDEHFSFVRSNSLNVSFMSILVQSVFLILGCYLISINQLSIGQLVSAEIILTGILNSLSNLPKTIEDSNFYAVSRLKIEKALGVHHD